MSIEAALAELTAAVKENTEAHLKLAAVATAAAGGKAGKPEAPKAEDKKAEAPKAEDKKAEKPKAEKPKAAKPKAKPEVAVGTTEGDIKALALGFIKTDDEEEREALKAKMRTALQHLGHAKATDIDNDEDSVKFATYLAYWKAGHEVDFEEIDGLVAEALEGAGADEDDDSDVV